MKILFINLPYYGHVVPTIGLVQELIGLGCEVTYLMPCDWEGKIRESGAKFAGYPNHRQLAEQMKNALATAEQMAPEFDLIVYEQFFFLGKHLAEKYHKGVVRIFTAPVTNEKLMAEYISTKGPLAIFRYKWIARAFTKDIAGNIPLKTDNWLDEIVHNPPELNLAYTLRDYQPYEEDFPEGLYRFLGPSIYARQEKKPDFVKGNRPVVYISLGTILKGATSFFQTCVDAFREENIDVIISVGPKFKTKKLKNVPENVHIYPSVSQLAVLEMADVFVTHGGMNSISEALVSGTPMVVIPFVSDQNVNAGCMERLGIAKRLEYAQVNEASLRIIVHDVANDASIRANLADIRKRIEDAPGNRGGAAYIIEYYERSQQNDNRK